MVEQFLYLLLAFSSKFIFIYNLYDFVFNYIFLERKSYFVLFHNIIGLSDIFFQLVVGFFGVRECSSLKYNLNKIRVYSHDMAALYGCSGPTKPSCWTNQNIGHLKILA